MVNKIVLLLNIYKAKHKFEINYRVLYIFQSAVCNLII